MRARLKLHCTERAELNGSFRLQFVLAPGDPKEDQAIFKPTPDGDVIPSGEVTFRNVNRNAADRFNPGEFYSLDLVKLIPNSN